MHQQRLRRGELRAGQRPHFLCFAFSHVSPPQSLINVFSSGTSASFCRPRAAESLPVTITAEPRSADF
jgi:hypothetical protein